MPELSVPAMLRAHARQFPDRVAVETQHEQVSYRELQNLANQVANAVVDRGSDPSIPIAQVFSHGLSPIVATLGVLSAGRIPTPIDVRDPTERVATVMEASGAELVITDARTRDLVERIAPNAGVLTLEDAAAHPTTAIEAVIDELTPGLLVFTSGSTGCPKGVLDAHCGATGRARMFGTRGYVVSGDRVGLSTSFTFAATYSRLFEALVNGATACTYDVRERGLRALPKWVIDRGVTTLLLVPSQLRMITLDDTPNQRMHSMRLVVIGGEAAFARDVRRARMHFGTGTVFLNRLGATEANVINGCIVNADVPADDALAVGSSDHDVNLRVVDPDTGAALAPGESGRLVIVARNLPLGYWNDPESTGSSYLPQADGRRAFMSSDFVRTRANGEIEYLGRLDGRVKVRGAMVALTEVEGALRSHPSLTDVVVVGAETAAGGTGLVAYVVPAPGAVPRVWQLRQHVAERLPSPMVPSAVVVLDALPRNERGKVERAALPEPAPVPTLGPALSTQTETERAVLELMRDVLALTPDEVGVFDDFFELGGDSLGGIELLVSIEERFGVRLAESTLLQAPTAAELAKFLDRGRGENSPVAVQFRPMPARGSVAPAFDGPALFFVGGGGASTLMLRPLANAVAPRHFYGLQQRGLETRGRPDRTVEAAARRFVAEVRSIQPTGPYRLGGYSFGGLIAFEMACRLVARGESVEVLALLDSTAPSDAPTSARHGSEVRAVNPGNRSRTRAIARSARLRSRALVATVRNSVGVRAGLVQRSRVERHRVFFNLAVRQAARYRPALRYGGHALVVRAAHNPLNDDRDRDLGWAQWITGPIVTEDLPADHDGLIRQPVVGALGALLRDARPADT